MVRGAGDWRRIVVTVDGQPRFPAMNIIQQLDKEQADIVAAQRPVPEFAAGDTVRVNVKVTEGTRTRVQASERR